MLAILCASIHCSKQNEMSDAYDWADDAARCCDLAVETLRDQYLAERLPGETVEQWRDRKQSRRILGNSYVFQLSCGRFADRVKYEASIKP